MAVGIELFFYLLVFILSIFMVILGSEYLLEATPKRMTMNIDSMKTSK